MPQSEANHTSHLGNVLPVVDYESPTPGTHTRIGTRARQVPTPSPMETAQARAAGAFADAALRRVLEVIDRRRPLVQLRPLLASGLVDSLLSAAGRRSGTGAASLRRVRVQLVGPPGTAQAAEVAAIYVRGDRVHAIACRVEQLPTVTGGRWQVVALHLG